MANSQRKPGNRKPLSSHPLFPAVVALWFAALFGLGSLAIRPSLIESLVLKTGIDLVIPAAAPPLGITARILIALFMASLGAAIGIALALRLTRPKLAVRERKRNAANPGAAVTKETGPWHREGGYGTGPACRPISAHEELGLALDADSLDPAGPLAGRRRSLAVDHQEQPFQPQEMAPLPGGLPQIFEMSAATPEPDSPVANLGDPVAPLDLGAFPAAEAAATAPEQAAAPHHFAPAAEPDHNRAEIAPALVSPASIEPLPPPGGLGMTDLAQRLQQSMARRRAAQAQPALSAALPVVPPPQLETAADPAPVELDESAFVPPPPLAIFADAALDDPVLTPDLAPAPLPMPAALRPVHFDAPDDEDHSDLVSLMPRHLTLAPAALAGAAAPLSRLEQPEAGLPEDEADLAADGFASLLSIEQARQDFAQIETPDEPALAVEPVVIFPGQMIGNHQAFGRPFDAPSPAASDHTAAANPPPSPVNPGEAELALRSALANLQRISGTA